MKISVSEQKNERTKNIATVSIFEAVKMINFEDRQVARVVGNILHDITLVVEQVVLKLKNGGRLLYIGSGTSGRLGVLDASEIPPTFSVSYDLVQGIIAGGYDALYKAAETSEDDEISGIANLQSRSLTDKDVVIGIAASGTTPYTLTALEYARQSGCFTACITCVPNSPLTKVAEIALVAEVGPEAIAGSSRMKAGTAQKMILNIISTVTMIQLGYTKGNQMSNVKASNKKLKERALRILMEDTGLGQASAEKLLSNAEDDQRVALVMYHTDVTNEVAKQALQETSFKVGEAIFKLKQ